MATLQAHLKSFFNTTLKSTLALTTQRLNNRNRRNNFMGTKLCQILLKAIVYIFRYKIIIDESKLKVWLKMPGLYKLPRIHLFRIPFDGL